MSMFFIKFGLFSYVDPSCAGMVADFESFFA